ncbi:MAG: SIS domain-containing protein, partial [Actinobacteria bacterium]|nr:SIS domain-containing protein [Actinomycetota bacterium]
ATSPTVPTTAIVADPSTPVAAAAGQVIALDFADEQSVVQTRFATTELALLLTHLGQDIEPMAAAAAEILQASLPDELLNAEQVTFLGTGWTYGLASEAALKLREAARFWSESYPAMEYRHGPIAVAGPRRVVWMFGPAPEGLADEVAAAGGVMWQPPGAVQTPLAELVRVHLVAAAMSRARGLNPDRPRNLTRSVILVPR